MYCEVLGEWSKREIVDIQEAEVLMYIHVCIYCT